MNPSSRAARRVVAALLLAFAPALRGAGEIPDPDLFDGSALPPDPQGPLAAVVRSAGQQPEGAGEAQGGGAAGGAPGGQQAGPGGSGGGAGGDPSAPSRQGVGGTAGIAGAGDSGAIGTEPGREPGTAGQAAANGSAGQEGPPLPAAPRAPRIGDPGSMVRGVAAAESAPGSTTDGPIGSRTVATEQGSGEQAGANDPLQRTANAGGSRGGTGGNEQGGTVPPDL